MNVNSVGKVVFELTEEAGRGSRPRKQGGSKEWIFERGRNIVTPGVTSDGLRDNVKEATEAFSSTSLGRNTFGSA